FFRWRAIAKTCSILFVQGRRLFGVSWRLRVGRAGTGGSVSWRPTPGECELSFLGGQERLQLSAAQGAFLRRRVKEHIAVGGRIAVRTRPVENRDQIKFVQNLQILFHGRA